LHLRGTLAAQVWNAAAAGQLTLLAQATNLGATPSRLIHWAESHQRIHRQGRAHPFSSPRDDLKTPAGSVNDKNLGLVVNLSGFPLSSRHVVDGITNQLQQERS